MIMRQSLLLRGILLWKEARATAGAHLLYFGLCPLPLVLTLGTTEKSLALLSLLHPSGVVTR